jgi:glutaredoxin
MAKKNQLSRSTSIAEAATPARVRVLLTVFLVAIFIVLQLWPRSVPAPDVTAWQDDGRLHVFVHPDCIHCHEAQNFLRTQPEIDVVVHDVSTKAGWNLYREVATELGIEDSRLGVPLFVFGVRHIIGFDRPVTTGAALLALITAEDNAMSDVPSRIDIPIFGEVDPAQYSLLALTIVMGLADGFNPCAMWVLIYIISIIAGLRDPAKIWWLVGTFVLTSGILYFLLMTAWLNMFLVVGYVRPLTELVALAAIGFGISHLYELVWTRGAIECEVGNIDQRQRTMARIRNVVAAPIGVGSLFLVVGLAFAVNAIEFVCSAALPAIYTHVLALSDVTTAGYYAYIALYVLFFMLDDLIIFGLAAFAVQRIINSRYAIVCMLAGGVVLIALGAWMLAR